MVSSQSDNLSTKHSLKGAAYDSCKDHTDCNQSSAEIRVKAENTPLIDTIESSIAMKAEPDLPPDISSTEQSDDIDYNVALQALWHLVEQNAPNTVKMVTPNHVNRQSAVPKHCHSTDSTVEHMVQSVLSMPMSTSMSMSNPLPPPICPISIDLPLPSMFPLSSSSSSDAMGSDHIDVHRAVPPLPAATSLHSDRAVDGEQNASVSLRGGHRGSVRRNGPISTSLPSAESLMSMDDEEDRHRHRYRSRSISAEHRSARCPEFAAFDVRARKESKVSRVLLVWCQYIECSALMVTQLFSATNRLALKGAAETGR